MRRMAPATAAALMLVIAGCSSDSAEPAGLDGTATTTVGPVPDPTDTPAATTSTPDPPDDATPEPEASFTQPHLPGDEPSVISLAEELPIEAPEGVTDDDLQVLEAAGRFMASWQAVLFGADDKQSGIRDVATGVQLDRLIDLIGEMDREEWVFIGTPMQLEALDLGVAADRAEVDLCIRMLDWFEIRQGAAAPASHLERYRLDLRLLDDQWLVEDTAVQDNTACGG